MHLFVMLMILSSVFASRPLNVLYLVADDMRPELALYGFPRMSTPHLDALAASALVFDSAYTQFAYCAPSRNSFMTGRRPERTKCLNFLTDFRKEHGTEWVSMPQYFKNAGYFTTAAGKLYHDGMDDNASWSFPSNQTGWWGYPIVEGDDCDVYGNYCAVTNASVIPWTDEDLVLAEGMARMRLAHSSGQPWWVGIGIHRPHWPNRLPTGWLGPEVYPGVIAPPKYPLGVSSVPYMSGGYRDGDFKNPELGCPTCAAPTLDAIEYRRWYYAGVSYADHMLGMALDLLDELGERENTVVVFHSDHGYQLGELNEWSKKTNNELATRVPLIMRAPDRPAAVGKRTDVRAELVDIYRTLVDLTGLNASAVQDDVQGVSLAPLFDSPATPPPLLASKAAFSQIGSCACKVYTVGNWTGLECNKNRCGGTPVAEFDFMGYTMRASDGWRYTLWAHMDNATERVDFSLPSYDELFDLTADDGSDFDYDNYAVNVAPANPALVATMKAQLIASVLTWY